MGGGGSSLREVKVKPTAEQRPTVNTLGLVIKEGFKYKNDFNNKLALLLIISFILLFFIYYKLRYKKI